MEHVSNSTRDGLVQKDIAGLLGITKESPQSKRWTNARLMLSFRRSLESFIDLKKKKKNTN